MKKTGAELVRYALEQIGVIHTFGIPGVHNTEIYDQLNMSDTITPILVTHEGGAAFMADAVSRVGRGVGTLVVVPAAGLTHASSGIGEAFLDGIPMLVICGGVRNDLEFEYQLHQMDQHKFMSGLTKRTFYPQAHAEIVPSLFEAYDIATGGEPGPVFVEIPVNLQLMKGEVPDMPSYQRQEPVEISVDDQAILKAAEILKSSKRPGIFAGWGARGAADLLKEIAEKLEAPVATTLQGISVFPETHPLHAGMGYGPSAVPAAQAAFEECDALIAIGTRFSEIPTGSFGITVPDNLIHIDINPDAIGANYPAKVGLEADARVALKALTFALGNDTGRDKRLKRGLRGIIEAEKRNYRKEWKEHDSGEAVNPLSFFDALRAELPDDGIVVVDDGNHTFLAAELLSIRHTNGFICPSDFNCMGYATPAAIGAKLANPDKDVVAIVGDGAFTMTCMEILTATRNKVGAVFCVFNDGELSQIAQAQELPYNRKSCTVLGDLNLQGVALATGAEYLQLVNNEESDQILSKALQIARNSKPVIVDVAIDYSKKTAFTKGTVQTNFKRFPAGTKMRFLGRALMRKVTG
ncbi:MAG: thiamine pyrophosphate-binding protein [Sneathiella sp.]|nr:thiamine pyrophosphate-binding protein [Sneathiella sp.]